MTEKLCHGPERGWSVILGPPGTGKTTRLIEHLRAALATGVPPARVTLVTFTRAARDEALERVSGSLHFGADDFPWLRTIHSIAYRLLELKPGRVMSRDGWQEFAVRFGYVLSDMHPGDYEVAELPRTTGDDLLRFAYSWGMNRRLEPASTIRSCPVEASPTHFPLFLERLARFKAERGLLDFPDMLVEVIERGLRPDVDVAFLDEAQDLSPLQIAAVETWFEPCRQVFVAGDDDQAIYAFQGADPSWLHGLAQRWPVEILQQSRRVPGAVFALAQNIIRRNQTRIEKPYRPTDDVGLVDRIDPDELPNILDPETDTLVLARNREFLRPIARALFERRIPYVVEGPGGISPLSNPDVVRAVRTSAAIFCKQAVDARELEAFLKFIPSRGCDLLPHGVKQRVKERNGQLTLDIMRQELGLGRLLDRIRVRGSVEPLIKLAASERGYLEALLMHYGEIPEPKIHLTTIHGAKGREADTVVLIPDMSRATYAEYTDYSRGGFEAENRVAYVGVTRARRRLVLARPRTRRFYEDAESVAPTPGRDERRDGDYRTASPQ